MSVQMGHYTQLPITILSLFHPKVPLFYLTYHFLLSKIVAHTQLFYPCYLSFLLSFRHLDYILLHQKPKTLQKYELLISLPKLYWLSSYQILWNYG